MAIEWLIAILLSIAPVSELRGAIPYAIAAGMHPVSALVLCCAANIAVVPFVWTGLDIMHYFIERIPFLQKWVDHFIHRARRKLHSPVEKYGYFGLAVFIGVPFPATGAWTGTIGAWALGMRRWPAFFSAAIGVLAAGIIVTLIVVTGAKAFTWLLA